MPQPQPLATSVLLCVNIGVRIVSQLEGGMRPPKILIGTYIDPSFRILKTEMQGRS